MNHGLLYLDSSAIHKLIVPEPESKRLHALLADWPDRISSELARTEVLRALRRARVTSTQFQRGEKVLERINLIPIDSRVLRAAALLNPTTLRSLDAIHLATALSLGKDVAAIVTYDTRLAQAATAAKLKVVSPGS